MSSKDKEFYWRMEGMGYALKIAREKGIDGLEQELKQRNFTKLNIPWDVEEWNKSMLYLANTNYHNMLTIGGASLNENFGFGKDRLKKWRDGMERITDNAFDLTFLMNHYVKLEDYAVDLNARYDLGIDANVVAFGEDIYHESRKKNFEWLQGVINTLRIKGFDDASDYLQGELDNAKK